MNGGKPSRGKKKNGFELVRGILGSVWEKNFVSFPFPFSPNRPTILENIFPCSLVPSSISRIKSEAAGGYIQS